MTEKGIELIKCFEGCRLEAYKCPAGVLTIGYGHTDGVHAGDRITEAEAERLLREDLQYYENGVSMALAREVSDYQKDALVSFAYNVGMKALRTSTLLKKVNKNPNDMSIRKEFTKWVRGGGKVLPGLVTRRSAEAELYFTHKN